MIHSLFPLRQHTENLVLTFAVERGEKRAWNFRPHIEAKVYLTDTISRVENPLDVLVSKNSIRTYNRTGSRFGKNHSSLDVKRESHKTAFE